jgi:hypothetical protein
MDDKERAILIIKALADAIVETLVEAENSSLGGIPTGHLYAVLMGQVSLNTFQAIMNALERSGRVAKIGPHLYAAGKNAQRPLKQ